ncbi:hypothetical protein ISS08_02235 [Candidatus Pacearchaeota archaeon]|nr:hypothetical protein [Candidatus Pacearchaeota archaeon]
MNEIIFEKFVRLKKVVDEGDNGSISISYETDFDESDNLSKSPWQFSKVEVKIDDKGRFHSVAYGDKCFSEAVSVYQG